LVSFSQKFESSENVGPEYNTMHESYVTEFDGFGKVALVNESDDVSGTRFFITLGDFSHLNKKNIVIGEIVGGQEELYMLASCGNSDGSMRGTVVIEDCGVVEDEYECPKP
jgi:cyclophilin family peptidyl-prolyl cis-trans isomerase